MTETANIGADEVQRRLPHGWRVENDGEGAVYGYADGDAPRGFPNTDGIPACFSVRKGDDLWAATWKGPHKLDDELDELSDRIHGTKERCIEWVAKKANNADG